MWKNYLLNIFLKLNPDAIVFKCADPVVYGRFIIVLKLLVILTKTKGILIKFASYYMATFV